MKRSFVGAIQSHNSAFLSRKSRLNGENWRLSRGVQKKQAVSVPLPSDKAKASLVAAALSAVGVLDVDLSCTPMVLLAFSPGVSCLTFLGVFFKTLAIHYTQASQC